MIFTYTATNSVIAGHSTGETYTVEFDVQSAVPQVAVTRDVVKSLSGKRETLRHRSEKTWSVKFAPLRGDKLPALEEMLDSMSDGQTVTVYLYGDETAPKSMLMNSDSYSFEEFAPVGSEASDLWVTTIELVLA